MCLLLGATACGGGGEPSPRLARVHGHETTHRPGSGGHGRHYHKRFEKAEEWARVFDDPARDAWQKPDEVVRLLGLSPGMTVIDLGAGTGYFVARLSRAVGDEGRVIATDIEPDMVRYLRERARREQLGNVEAVLTPAEGLAGPSFLADRILIVDVWHHLPDRERYAAGLAALLRPGGRIAVVDFTLDARHGPPREHRLPPETIRAELASAGLAVELADETLPDQYVVIATKQQLADPAAAPR